jgi:hypothetical protein
MRKSLESISVCREDERATCEPFNTSGLAHSWPASYRSEQKEPPQGFAFSAERI